MQAEGRKLQGETWISAFVFSCLKITEDVEVLSNLLLFFHG